MSAGWVESAQSEARKVADAVLYEGYLLYPYRSSSAKNQMRWQFGVIAPRSWIEARGTPARTVAGSQESWFQRTECLLETGPAAHLVVLVRFLQMESRAVEELRPDGRFVAVDCLTVAGERHLTFDGAVPREYPFHLDLADGSGWEHTFEVVVPGGRSSYPLGDAEVAGRLTHTREEIRATVRVSVHPARLNAMKLVVEVTNTGAVEPDASRPEALAASLIACHSIVEVKEGSFLSLLDPPGWAAAVARECVNVGTFPVLAGPPGWNRTILSSPIILYDHPRVAPESPGDLFDATEIDEILSLRTLTLTEAEKAEARATDRRAAEIIARVDAMPEEIFSRLHGAVRSLRPVATSGLPGPGSRVVLRPRTRGTDAQDMFLVGRTATVTGVMTDVDGTQFLAVTVDGDPRSTLDAGPGRLRHFRLDEVECQ